MWFQTETIDYRVRVEFQAPAAPEWMPAIMLINPLPAAEFHGREVVLAGKAPMWMYAHAAIIARRAGARSIHVFQPSLQNTVQIHPINAEAEMDPGWLHSRNDGAAGGSIAEFRNAPVGLRWDPEMLPHLAKSSMAWEPDVVTLTGIGANWMYSAAAALAAGTPGRAICYFSPKEMQSILLTAADPESIWIPPCPGLTNSDGALGKVIGVVGDPNSGKSVLSNMLLYGFRHAGLEPVWRVDCDHAAPTTGWYLEMIRQNRDEEAKVLRDQQKRSWTPEAERSLAEQLNCCTRSMRWVLADFPGGIHKGGRVQRIPTGREVLLGSADRFVIVHRGDQPDAETSWREALAAYRMENRVIATVESGDPKATLGIWRSGTDSLRAKACGLDRSRLTPTSIQSSLPDWAAFCTDLAQRISHSFS